MKPVEALCWLLAAVGLLLIIGSLIVRNGETMMDMLIVGIAVSVIGSIAGFALRKQRLA